jgi:hypothetical protein
MAIDFPASPTLNDVFTVGNVTYVWDGTKWTASVTGGISLDKIEEGNTSAEVIDTGSDGRFVVTTEGTERLFVNSNGNISVGSSLNDSVGSTTTLTVDQTSGNGQISLGANGTVRGRIFADNSTGELRIGNPTAGDLMLYTNNTERLRIDSSGRLGIGTSTPNDVLHVEGTIRTSSSSSNAQFANNFLRSNQAGTFYFDQNSGSQDFAFRLSNVSNLDTTAMTIKPSGRVGIGTTSPSGVIHIKADTDQASLPSIVLEDSSTTSTRLGSLTNITGDIILAATTSFIDRASITLKDDQNILLKTGATERARIDSSGRLLVGTSTNIGSQNIQIGTAQGTLGLYKFANNDDGGELTFATSRNGTVGSQTIVNNGDFLGRMFFRGSDGSAFIRGAEIACRVDGTPGANDMPGRLVFSTTSDGASAPTQRMRITSTGAVLIHSGSFNFIADPDKTVDGFLAHEAQAVVPECVTGTKDEVDDENNPVYQGIDQSKLVPLLTAALQEAIAKIETLEGMVAVNNITIDEQQHQLSTLAARLTALENA